MLQQKLPMPGYALISAWQEVPTSGIVGMLDTVRNRVLKMALEIQAEVGDKYGDPKKITPDELKKVDQTIVTNIFRGSVYVNTGQSRTCLINGG